jgi:hypothetical protein
VNLIARHVPVTDKLLAGLIHIESLWQLLSSQVDGEGVSSIVGEMNFSDLDSVVSKEVVPHELKILAPGEEAQHFSVIIKELFLGRNSSSSEFLLQELQ